MTFGEKVIRFNSSLQLDVAIPDGVSVLYPHESDEVKKIPSAFYSRYYNDNLKRRIILGINPGRLGAGATGIPFTDTKRLTEYCNIKAGSIHTHEPSSVFVYRVIEASGGVDEFYRRFYISSVCPLGFVSWKNNKAINYNYYDDVSLAEAIRPFVISSLEKQLDFGVHREVCICFGTGKNADYINKLNDEHGYFERVIPLEHPRYIMQYKASKMDLYIEKYLEALQ